MTKIFTGCYISKLFGDALLQSFRAIFCMKSSPQNNNHFRSFSNKVTFWKLTSMVDLVPVLICDYSIFPSEALLGFYNPWPCFWTYRNKNTAIILSDLWLNSRKYSNDQQPFPQKSLYQDNRLTTWMFVKTPLLLDRQNQKKSFSYYSTIITKNKCFAKIIQICFRKWSAQD